MTRMWIGIDPADLCDQHLLGEHSELHMEIGTWLRHPHGEAVVKGHVDKAQVIPSRIRERHAALVGELEARGVDHDSPLEDFSAAAMPSPPQYRMNGIHEVNRDRLRRRCADCRERLMTKTENT